MKLYQTALALLMLTASPALAQQMNHDHMPGMTHGKMSDSRATAGRPVESGQSAFAAIQEIVEILESDPSTDWSKVDIEALRQHLIDMNNVTLEANIEASKELGGMRFTVSGTGSVRDSIRRMLVAHALTMDGHDGWRFAAEATPEGAVLRVTPAEPSQMEKLRALGFIGAMTRSMHHQAHHLMIARGHSPH